MHLLLALLLLAGLATAGTITFKSQDGVDRVIHFTPNAGLKKIGDLHVGPGQSVNQWFPHGWIGNFYAKCVGCHGGAGMLGEVAFDGFQGKTFYDVSAIVGPNDHTGVHRIFPVGGGPQAGCENFPCPKTTYYRPNDVQTKVTEKKHLVVTLGGGGRGGNGGKSGTWRGGNGGKSGTWRGGNGGKAGAWRGGNRGQWGRNRHWKRRLLYPSPETSLYIEPQSDQVPEPDE